MASCKGVAASRDDALNTQMPDKNWKRVKDVFHEALRRSSDERAQFLDDECNGDKDLRIEVESLLESLREAQTFLETPIISASADRQTEWHLENGRRLSHYKIIEPIGSGGMGEVYLAEDERLRRQVALKVLPLDLAQDRTRLSRFQREANAVSALNHPNILTIFEFENVDGLQYFASEFVRGVTLRERLDRSPLSTAESLEIAVQIASALYAAHSAGVIHRDIKPENVMIRDDGFVKVLDFGLAKQTAKIVSGETDTTLTQRYSLPGMIMGTVTYMSPEQARGSIVDERSDLFALGIVLYEMLAGRTPFRGDSAADVIAEIIQIDPPPPSSISQQVPAELDEVVLRTLAKDATQRYQSADELRDILKRILKRLDFDAEFGDSSDSHEVVKPSPAVVVTGEGRSHQTSYLPDLTPMIGRTRELDELTDLILNQKKRLITLTGIGGTGKTRLTQELCRRLEQNFTDGYRFVRLADVHDSQQVSLVMAQQLRVQEIVGRPVAETVLEHLRSKQMMLVLDNFEQIIGAAPIVAELLAAATEIQIVVTSRERLNLQAEIEYNVQPLPIPEDESLPAFDDIAQFDSVKLFVERAKYVDPEFRLNATNAEHIAKICSTLDGLPLAIELAAARARVFSADVILEKLEERLSFLTGGAVDRPERQRTMRAAVEWSYDLLDDDEKRLFRRLSVFGCQFSAEAAEAVASEQRTLTKTLSTKQSVEFADTFASLVDKSLVYRRLRHGGKVAYGLLEIVREYAESRLEADDDAETVRRRHAYWYLDLAEKAEPHLLTKGAPVWVSRLDDDYDNVRTALSWSTNSEPLTASKLAAAIRQFWLVRGHLSEGLAWSEDILSRDAEIPAEIKWKLLTVCGNISQFKGDVSRAHQFYGDALVEARKSADQNYVAKSLRGVGALAYMERDLETARRVVEEAIAISKNIGDEFGRAASLARLGDISIVEGDAKSAREYTLESLEIFRSLGYTEGVSAKLYNLGSIVFQQGESELARSYFEEAYTTAVELGEKINTRLIFDGFAALAAESGDHKRAAKLSGVADSLGATVGYTIEPAEQKFRDHYLDKLKRSLSADEFASEYEAGKRMPHDDARQLACLSIDDDEKAKHSEYPVSDQIEHGTMSDLVLRNSRRSTTSMILWAAIAAAVLAFLSWLWFSAR